MPPRAAWFLPLASTLMIEGYEVVSTKGAVAAAPAEAARIGARLLEQGGNAMDAASAAALACCMLAPHKNGVGGYMSSAVVVEGSSGRISSLDASGKAPAAAREEMYEILPARPPVGINEDEYNCSVRDDANVFGPLAVAVPGQMAAMGGLWERWGRRPWEHIVAPSQQLLEDGFPYGEELAADTTAYEQQLRRYEPTCRHLLPDGRLPRPEDVWHRPDMEKTLRRLATAGWRDFYDGELGRTIADGVQAAGGILSREDMASYEAQLGAPYGGSYRDAQVYGPVLTHGSITPLQMLQMLECFEPAAPDQTIYWHRFAEVAKLAWRDRLLYLADPDFVEVPVERLLSREYARGRVESLLQAPLEIDSRRRRSSGKAQTQTLHLSAADAEGNLVSMTITQGGEFGSCFTVPGTGILLGHGMCRLDPNPGRANSVAPGKRPLNNGCPLLVRLPDRDVAIGLPGGRRIVCVATMMAQQLVDLGATSLEAARSPRLHVATAEPLEALDTVAEDIVAGLRAMGHEVEVVDWICGNAHGAEFLKGDGRVRAGGNGWAAGVE